jgi:hypothetical protein
MDVKLILYDNLFILGREPKDAFLDDDILIYIKDKEKAKILKESEYIDIGDIIDDIYKIAKIGKLYNKASNIYLKLDEKNKEKFKEICNYLLFN